jgi:uncharacterized protein VirK/YbjX
MVDLATGSAKEPAVPSKNLAAARVASAGSHTLRHYILFLKSIYTGTIHLISKAFESNIFGAAWRFHKLADESIVAVVIGHLKVARTMNRPGTLALTKRYPNLVRAYLNSNYLAKSFSRKTRREILKFHYEYMMEYVVESFFEQIVESSCILWSKIINDNRYAISLSFNSKSYREGDLSLIFSKNNISLYEISFTVVPGTLIGCAADRVLLVGRVQGEKDQIEEIRSATRACGDIAPPHLLMVAAQSIAGTLVIGAIGGVSKEQQLSASNDVFVFDYDAFWKTFIVKKETAGIYEILVPFLEKPLEQISLYHRRRARRKRQYKKQIGASVAAAFAETFLKTQLPSSLCE